MNVYESNQEIVKKLLWRNRLENLDLKTFDGLSLSIVKNEKLI